MSTWKVIKTKKKKDKMVVKFKVGFGFENCNSFSILFLKRNLMLMCVAVSGTCHHHLQLSQVFKG